MNKREKQLVKWGKLQKKGVMSYLIKTGIFYFGLTFFLGWVFLAPLIDNNFTFNFIYKETFKTKFIVFGILSPLIGMLMAYSIWNSFKREYE
jgi:hypothetical protein